MPSEPWNAPIDRPRVRIAWEAVARALSDGSWHSREELIEIATRAGGDQPLQRSTINGILSEGAREGYFERWPKNAKRAKYGARRYRVTEEGRRQRGELRVG